MKKITLFIAILSAGLLQIGLSAEDPAGAPAKDPGMRMPPPPPPPHRMPPPTPDDRFFNLFPENEREDLKKMAKEDPAAFHKEMRKRFRAEREKTMKHLMELRENCLKEKDPEKRKEQEKILRQDLSEKFDMQINGAEQRIKDNEEALRKMQARLDEFKKETQRRKEMKESILDKMTQEILKPDFKLKDPAKRPMRDW